MTGGPFSPSGPIGCRDFRMCFRSRASMFNSFEDPGRMKVVRMRVISSTNGRGVSSGSSRSEPLEMIGIKLAKRKFGNRFARRSVVSVLMLELSEKVDWTRWNTALEGVGRGTAAVWSSASGGVSVTSEGGRLRVGKTSTSSPKLPEPPEFRLMALLKLTVSSLFSISFSSCFSASVKEPNPGPT